MRRCWAISQSLPAAPLLSIVSRSRPLLSSTPTPLACSFLKSIGVWLACSLLCPPVWVSDVCTSMSALLSLPPTPPPHPSGSSERWAQLGVLRQPPTSYLVHTFFFLFCHVVMSDSATPWTAACQAALSFTISQSLLKLMFPESVLPSDHHILCHPCLLPSVFPSIRVFSNESALYTQRCLYVSAVPPVHPDSLSALPHSHICSLCLCLYSCHWFILALISNQLQSHQYFSITALAKLDSTHFLFYP